MNRIRATVGVFTALCTIGVTTVAWAEDGEDAPPVDTTVYVDEPTTTIEFVVPVDESTTTEAPVEDPTTTAAIVDSTVADEEVVDESTTTEAPTTTNAQVHQDQATVITGTVVANADTGNNSIVNEAAPGGVAPSGGTVDTGSAAAIGSRDENIVVQEAAVVLSDEAVANLLQIALILNIGAALANSGLNDIFSSPDGSGATGDVSTGDATAIGNSIASYITQAANAEGTNAIDDTTSQLAISLFLGLAVSNSGLNTVAGNGVAGSGGSIGTGETQAIGNDSLTAITQQAILAGAGTAELNVIQRATVLNLGFALANSGLNGISGVAGELLAATDEEDDALAEQLFAMLLPALLQSYGYGAGSGAVATGAASAVGNQSETHVLQTVGAEATGDGKVSVLQEVLVANVGGAAANTGANALGGGQPLALDQSATAVIQMAAFLAQLLAMVHHSSDAATELANETQSIEVPFGDLLLRLDGSFGSLDTTIEQGGARANLRQISIVISLGVAEANTGENTILTLSDTTMLAAVNALIPELIDTGNADSANRTLVQICQRINALDVACLAPPPPPETGTEQPVVTLPIVNPTNPPVVSTPIQTFRQPLDQPVARPGTLPATGTDIESLLQYGALVFVVGAVLLIIRRRPRTTVA